jgi:DNA-binding transcriptional ArsR family regulator
VDVLELLGHPIRLRIVHALRGGRTLTTAQLCALLPDVSKATVYRHVDLLAGGGILDVAAERRVRGAVERTFRLRPERATVDPAQAAALTTEEHRRAFGTAVAALVAEFGAYLDRPDADPATDPVGYRQHGLWLDDTELAALLRGLGEAIRPHLKNPAAPGRNRYLLAPILFPAENSVDANRDDNA